MRQFRPPRRQRDGRRADQERVLECVECGGDGELEHLGLLVDGEVSHGRPRVREVTRPSTLALGLTLPLPREHRERHCGLDEFCGKDGDGGLVEGPGAGRGAAEAGEERDRGVLEAEEDEGDGAFADALWRAAYAGIPPSG